LSRRRTARPEPIRQGRGNAKAYLDEHPATAKEIEDKIYAALGLGKDLVTPIERDKDAAAPVPMQANRSSQPPDLRFIAEQRSHGRYPVVTTMKRYHLRTGCC
jgi:hypothetical protein